MLNIELIEFCVLSESSGIQFSLFSIVQQSKINHSSSAVVHSSSADIRFFLIALLLFKGFYLKRIPVYAKRISVYFTLGITYFINVGIIKVI